MTRPPATLAADTELAPTPVGGGDRFSGYGVMGLPFASGHVLALRRFPASSIGPGYTSVWHRDPDHRWTFWQDQPDAQSCLRYFSDGASASRRVEIDLDWPGASRLAVAIPAVGLTWTVDLAATPATRALSALGGALPDRAWRSRAVLTAMGPVAGALLGAGTLGMVGRSPNGQRFTANPRRVWVVDDSSASLGEVDLGPPGRLAEQARLGDFRIPQRGIFVIGRAFFDPDPAPGPGQRPEVPEVG